MKTERNNEDKLAVFARFGKYLAWTSFLFVAIMFSLVLALSGFHLPKNFYADKPNPSIKKSQIKPLERRVPKPEYWKAPNTMQLQGKADADLIRYGRNLIVRTAYYFGPQGIVGKLTNGMNCQNCHLDAGTRPFANNFSIFYAGFPKMSARSGRKEEAFERIDECFERSMNGKAPGRNSREMLAMLAYLKWVGKKQDAAHSIADNSVKKIPYLDAAAVMEKRAKALPHLMEKDICTLPFGAGTAITMVQECSGLEILQDLSKTTCLMAPPTKIRT